MASEGVIDLSPESTLWILIQTSSCLSWCRASHWWKPAASLNVRTFFGSTLTRCHQRFFFRLAGDSSRTGGFVMLASHFARRAAGRAGKRSSRKVAWLMRSVAEVAKILAQLTPADQRPRGVEIADHDRPDHALGRAVLAIAIAQRDLASGAHPGARLRDIDPVGRDFPGRRSARRRIEDQGSEVFRDRGGDLGNQVACRARERRIAVSRDPLRAEHRRLDLVRGQHERRQVEAAFQHVAEPGFTPHRDALADQRRDVAIDRAFRGFELGRERRRRHGTARATKDLDDLEQAVGAAHGNRLEVAC